MRRPARYAAAALALLALSIVTGAHAGQATPIRIVETESSFPERTYLLTLPERMRLTAQDVAIRENGRAVHAPSVSPAHSAGGKQFGVVLAIDASSSMRGEPLEKAMAAARAFARQDDAYQELAALAFNSDTQILLPFSSRQGEIQEALSSTPKVAYWTRMYEALDHAIGLVEAQGFRSASIVLLSDGQELGSRGTLEGAVERARSAGVRIFGVGLQSRFFDSTSLRTLAAATGGSYLEADSPDQLGAIFDQLGAQLSNEYLVSYRSLAGPGERIEVQVSVVGLPGAAVAGYATPELADPVAAGPYEPSLAVRFWTSPFTMVGVGLLCAALFSLFALTVLRPESNDLLRRMSGFVSISRLQEERRHAVALTDRLAEGTERSLEGTQWWARFREDVELAELPITAARILLFTAVGTVLVAWVFFMFAGPIGVVVGLAVPLISRSIVGRRVRRKRKQFAEQLPDNLEVVASALRAGHSLVGALSVVVEDAPEPSRTEFRRVVADEQLGVPLEDSIGKVVRRMDNRDLDQVALVAALQRQTGGSAAEVLDRVTETIRERAELRRLVGSLTAQGRLSRWILSLLPVALLLAIGVINPGYTAPLFTEPLGRICLILAGIMVVSGSLVIRKIVDIKV